MIGIKNGWSVKFRFFLASLKFVCSNTDISPLPIDPVLGFASRGSRKNTAGGKEFSAPVGMAKQVKDLVVGAYLPGGICDFPQLLVISKQQNPKDVS